MKVMSRRLITANTSESVISAAMKMIENNIRHLPVVEEGRQSVWLALGTW